MNYRQLGKTNLKVSEIALGCEGFMNKSQEEVTQMIKEAEKLGVNFIDLYSSNPILRSHLGNAIKENREHWIYEAHLSCVWKDDQYLRTRKIEEVKEGFEDLLVRLQTDYIDIGMIHYIDALKDFEEVFKGDVLKYALELKNEGKIKSIGISSHNPEVALAAAKTGLVDVILFSINPCYDMVPPTEDVDVLFEKETYDQPLTLDPVRKEFYEYCEKEKIAITVMKAFGGGDLLDEKLSPFKVKMSVNQCIHYCLTRPGVVSVMAGSHSIEELKEVCAYENASQEEKDYALVLSKVEKHSFQGHCVYCGHCAPCTKKIDIASVHKYLDLCIAQNEVIETAREHYEVLEHHASECIECGACMKNCPFGVDILSKMKKAVELFGK